MAKVKLDFEIEQDFHLAKHEGEVELCSGKLIRVDGFEELFCLTNATSGDFDDYVLSEISTGMRVKGGTKKEAFEAGIERLNDHKNKWASVYKDAKAVLKRNDIKFPVNEIIQPRVK